MEIRGLRPFLIFSAALTAILVQIPARAAGEIRLERLRLPAGFNVQVFADDVPSARSLALGPQGTVFVGTREKKVFAVTDTDGDGKAERVLEVAQGLQQPNGVAWDGSALYVGEISKIWRYDGVAEFLKSGDRKNLKRSLLREYPDKAHHGWKFLALGPDGMLYIPVGAPCNACLESDKRFASITRMKKDGSAFEIFAQGVRNTVGFDWHPVTKELWFTDNGRDMLGDDIPPCEINRAPKAGLHFGFPHCHGLDTAGKDVVDPNFGKGQDCAKFTKPEWNLQAHVAPLGMRFYTGKSFPKAHQGNIFFAEHGSWNRSSKVGYQVEEAVLENGKIAAVRPFLTGFLGADGSVSGRPVDVLNMPDGALLVSDDHVGAIYRVTYSGKKSPKGK